MQMLRSLRMDTTVKKDWLLTTLRSNREQHSGCYQESLDGYVATAKAKLTSMLEKLKDGKATEITLHLSVPTNHTPEYDTVIGMLENNVGELITLSAPEYRMLVEDEWDWMESWLTSNAGYSASTRSLAQSKGLL